MNEFPSKALYTIVLIVACIIGAGAASLIDPFLPQSMSNTKKGYANGFVAAKAIVEKSTIGAMYRTPDDVRMLSGTVTEVGSAEFTLHTPSNDPFADPALNDRAVHIDAATVVYNIEQRDSKTFQKEMEAYLAAMRHASSTPTALIQPSSAIKVRTDLSALKKGTPVTIMTKENIRDRAEFIATEIDIQQQAGAR